MPLTEDCGIIEWVPHTTGLRNCCQAAYVAEGLFDPVNTNPSIKKLYDNYPVRHWLLRPASPNPMGCTWHAAC